MSSLMTGLLGLVLGMRHALEPDHLAAVSTLSTEQKTPRAAFALGALWGLGHSLALFTVGGTLALLEAQMPERVALGFELAVALVIIGLGVRALAKAWNEGSMGTSVPHMHGGVLHVHAAPVAHVHVSRWTLATRPLLIGILHGLAGSGALTVLVLTHLSTRFERLTYILLFGSGSVVGMALLTGLVGASLAKLGQSPRAANRMLVVAGLLSLVVGTVWGLQAVNSLLA